MDYIGTVLQKSALDSLEYEKISAWCNETQLGSIIDKGSYYEVIALTANNEKEILLQEKSELEYWLRNHDYIGTKIATGRATIDEYADEIAEMRLKAERINELEQKLASI